MSLPLHKFLPLLGMLLSLANSYCSFQNQLSYHILLGRFADIPTLSVWTDASPLRSSLIALSSTFITLSTTFWLMLSPPLNSVVPLRGKSYLLSPHSQFSTEYQVYKRHPMNACKISHCVPTVIICIHFLSPWSAFKFGCLHIFSPSPKHSIYGD